jgi:hypothetical protein
MITQMSQVNYILSEIVKLEDQLLKNNFFSIFKKKNFYVIYNLILVEMSGLQICRQKLFDLHSSGKYCPAELEYVDALTRSTKALAHIAKRLDEKVKGTPYSFDQMNSDIAEFKALQSTYTTLGGLMNFKYKF